MNDIAITNVNSLGENTTGYNGEYASIVKVNVVWSSNSNNSSVGWYATVPEIPPSASTVKFGGSFPLVTL